MWSRLTVRPTKQQDMSRLDNIKFTPNPMHIHRFTQFIWQKSGRARARAITTTTLKSKQNSLSFSSVDSIDFVCSGGVTQSNRIGCSLLLLQLLTFNRRLFAYSEKRAASTR